MWERLTLRVVILVGEPLTVPEEAQVAEGGELLRGELLVGGDRIGHLVVAPAKFAATGGGDGEVGVHLVLSVVVHDLIIPGDGPICTLQEGKPDDERQVGGHQQGRADCEDLHRLHGSIINILDRICTPAAEKILRRQFLKRCANPPTAWYNGFIRRRKLKRKK